MINFEKLKFRVIVGAAETAQVVNRVVAKIRAIPDLEDRIVDGLQLAATIVETFNKMQSALTDGPRPAPVVLYKTACRACKREVLTPEQMSQDILCEDCYLLTDAQREALRDVQSIIP